MNCNMALCFMKKNKSIEAIRYANDAVKVNNQSSKAYFR